MNRNLQILVAMFLGCAAMAFAGCGEKHRPFNSTAATRTSTTNFSLPTTDFIEEQTKYLVEEHHYDGAWDRSIGQTDSSSPIVIAVLDSGRTHHEDLEGVYIDGGYDLIYNDGNVFVTVEEIQADQAYGGVYNHGTAVDGVIAALANDKGVTGAAPAVKIRAYRVFTEDGFTTEDVITDGVWLAMLDGCDIISMSFGRYDFSGSFQTNLREATYEAYRRGIILVAAAGNGSTEIGDQIQHYPASYPWVISVGATQRLELANYPAIITRAGFSNFGSHVDVYARGQDVYTTFGYYEYFDFDASEYKIAQGNHYLPANGTSFACPMVAALMGIAKSLDRTITVDRALTMLRESSTDFGLEGNKMLDARGFISKLSSPSAPPLTPPSAPPGIVAAPLQASIRVPTRAELMSQSRANLRSESLRDSTKRIKVLDLPEQPNRQPPGR